MRVSTPATPTTQPRLSRRSLVLGAAALGVATTLPISAACAAPARPAGTFDDLEQTYDRRIAVYAKNLETGQELGARADERVAMCSVFKVVAAAAVLAGRLITPSDDALSRPLPYPELMIPEDMWAPAAQRWYAEKHVPTLAEACEAAIADSDNAAVNLIMQQTGGPESITEYFGSLGDQTSRLDRWEVEMSYFTPNDPRDTTTPRAMAETFTKLIVGDALEAAERDQLKSWMAANRTDPPFAKALPSGWTLLDKTGSGMNYGTRNDVGIAWSPTGAPIVVSCLTRADSAEADVLNEPLTEVFGRCLEQLG